MDIRTERDLRRHIASLDRKGYPACKGLRGRYDFGDFDLSIDHVQGDPFAAPSRVSVYVPHDVSGFPPDLYGTPWRRTAFEDCLLRRFGRALGRYSFKAGGSGKSGLLSTSRPGPEIIERSACACLRNGVEVCLEVGFPAHGRSIAADELDRALADYVPRAVREALMFDARDARVFADVAELADDQHAMRRELERLGLVAFVADGSILPRASGVSSQPMPGALPFESPASMRVVLDLPHRGPTPGMGIARGVTLIVGGGYHGKSTLLKAIEAGVYDHVAGDGRECVATDATAVKVRAEDGRSVRGVDISLFIDGLPNDADTSAFSTDDASGSTSQAAATSEALEAGCRTLLIDEDTSATNFMVRDELMQEVVARDHEPITPFVERVRDLYVRDGVSSIIVVGSSGAFFPVADVVVQMDRYRASDITGRARAACARRGLACADEGRDAALSAGEGKCGRGPGRRLSGGSARTACRPADKGRQRFRRGDRIKVKAGRDTLLAGHLEADLRFVEQLVDREQTAALAHMVRWCLERDAFGTRDVTGLVEDVFDEVRTGGLAAMGGVPYPVCGLAMPRPQELHACLSRLRGL